MERIHIAATCFFVWCVWQEGKRRRVERADWQTRKGLWLWCDFGMVQSVWRWEAPYWLASRSIRMSYVCLVFWIRPIGCVSGKEGNVLLPKNHCGTHHNVGWHLLLFSNLGYENRTLCTQNERCSRSKDLVGFLCFETFYEVIGVWGFGHLEIRRKAAGLVQFSGFNKQMVEGHKWEKQIDVDTPR